MYDDWKNGLTDMFGLGIDDCEIHQEGEEEPEYILKACSRGREYEVLDFLGLSAPKKGSLWWEDGELIGVMRNCQCGTTLMVGVDEVSYFLFGGKNV